MFCPSCGNKIGGDSNFCDSCGHNLKKKADTAELKKNAGDEQSTKVKSADVLWKKFLEIIRAEGEKAKEYQEISSDAVWELIARFYRNSFNNLTEEFKTDLDKQPYKAIEAIKSYLQSFVSNSYQVYIAEKLLKEKYFEKADIKDPEILAEEWKRVYLNHNNKIIQLLDDVLTVLNAIDDQLGEGLFDGNPTLKDLPKAVVDGIKNQLIQQLIHGYLLGIAENNLRKNNSK